MDGKEREGKRSGEKGGEGRVGNEERAMEWEATQSQMFSKFGAYKCTALQQVAGKGEFSSCFQ